MSSIVQRIVKVQNLAGTDPVEAHWHNAQIKLLFDMGNNYDAGFAPMSVAVEMP